MASERLRRLTRRYSRKIDRYFRRTDTFLAKSLSTLSPSTGEAYMNGPVKRWLVDVGIGGLLAVGLTPVMIFCFLIAFLEDGHIPYFVHNRRHPNGTVQPVWKIKTMFVGSEMPTQALAVGRKPQDDPRVTRVGKVLRATGWLDETPQLWQVVLGDLTLVGLRITSQNRITDLQQVWSKETFDQWWKAYQKMTKGAVTGPNQILRFRKIKADHKRFQADTQYVENASLNQDLFWLWQTVRKVMW